MPIDTNSLTLLAQKYAEGMTSIRGRRVQRLLKREFAGAEDVLIAYIKSGTAAVIGLSPSGAGLCITDGRGKHASVIKWLHGAARGLETRFDLYKDSLPEVGTRSLPLAGLAPCAQLADEDSMVPPVRSLASAVLRVLA